MKLFGTVQQQMNHRARHMCATTIQTSPKISFYSRGHKIQFRKNHMQIHAHQLIGLALSSNFNVTADNDDFWFLITNLSLVFLFCFWGLAGHFSPLNSALPTLEQTYDAYSVACYTSFIPLIYWNHMSNIDTHKRLSSIHRTNNILSLFF